MALRRVVIIGVGNPFRGDDGAGIAVVHRLKGRFTSEVKLIEESGDGLLLLEAWRDASSVFVIDAMSSGGAPGTIRIVDAHKDLVPSKFFLCSTHAFGLTQAINLARILDRLSAEFLIFGIEGERFEPGSHMSPRVIAAVDEVATRIRYLVETSVRLTPSE